jgi:hypothetical protein
VRRSSPVGLRVIVALIAAMPTTTKAPLEPAATPTPTRLGHAAISTRASRPLASPVGTGREQRNRDQAAERVVASG